MTESIISLDPWDGLNIQSDAIYFFFCDFLHHKYSKHIYFAISAFVKKILI